MMPKRQREVSDDPVVNRAHDRFRLCNNRESDCRRNWLADYKFANADSDNGYAWPNDLRRNREIEQRPVLTINMVRVHNLRITNDARQNKSGIGVRPVGNGATFESAQVWKGLFRHIEYQSNAQAAYATAVNHQVAGGIGYWRIDTEYANEEDFNQEIFINRISDALSVFIDPDCKNADKSDARFAFVFDNVPRDQFEAKYPDYLEYAGQAVLGDDMNWLDNDHVRVAEYWEKTEKKDILFSLFDDETQTQRTVLGSKLTPEMVKALKADPKIQYRTTMRPVVDWYLIVGAKKADHARLAGKYIPIVPVIGEETIIEGHLDRKGHTRAMKDAQRMYNYNASSEVEFVALQTKVPWSAPAKAIEGFEALYETSNTQNHAVLPWNHWDDDAQQNIPAPQRVMPPNSGEAYVKGMIVAQTQLMDVSGQQPRAMGQDGNERTGEAINAVNRQSDNSTYHFLDNFGMALRHTGVILLDLIPKIYDSERIIKILAEDGSDLDVTIDPTARKAYEEKKQQNNMVTARILNPSIGRYEVYADTGPAYATRRQEAFRALTLLLTQSKELTPVIADIMLKAGDFPGADEAAQRLRRLVPPQALGIGPTPEEQKMQEQIQNLQSLLVESMDELGIEQNKSRSKDQLRDIDVYKAETDRMKVFQDAILGHQDSINALLGQLMGEASKTSLEPVRQASAAGLKDDIEQGDRGAQNQPPIPGAKQAQDGQWYMPDPNRPGKYLHIQTGGQGQ